MRSTHCAARLRLQRLVKRRIDFDGVEIIGEIAGFVKSFLAMRRVHHAFPIRVGPAGGSHVDSRGICHFGFRICRHLKFLTVKCAADAQLQLAAHSAMLTLPQCEYPFHS